MSNVLYLLSVPRSGHHAVMTWICGQEDSAAYYNNCRIEEGETVGTLHKFIKGNPQSDLERNIKYKDSTKDKYSIVLVNYVGFHPEDLYKLYNKDIKIVIVIRDIHNTVSSMYQKRGGVWSKKIRHIESWKIYTKLCLDNNNNIIDISFNKWFLSKDYRKNLAKRLDIKFTDKNLHHINTIGKSTFDPNITDGQKLGVLERYKCNDIDDNIDLEARELSDAYFGKII